MIHSPTKKLIVFSNHKIKTHTSVIFASKLIPWGSNDDCGIGDGEDDAENDDGDIDDGGDDEEGFLLTSVMFASIFTPGVWNSLL